MFRDECDEFINICETILRKSRLSDKSVCILLRTFHYTMPILTGAILVFGSKLWFNIVMLLNVLVFIMFYIFNGCIISKIEHRFTDDGFTIIDPFLEMINVELNNENRTNYSFYSSILGFIIIFGLYCYRFGMPNFMYSSQQI